MHPERNLPLPQETMTAITVLVVDDDEFNRLMLEALLESNDYRVVLAATGEEALEAFACHDIDIVLMDIIMPGIDGYETTRRIKSGLAHDHVPVIFLTSASDDQSLAECIDSGGDDFLTKPYSQVILNAKIQAQLRMRQLYYTIKKQNIALQEHQAHELQEQEVANGIFSRIVHLDCLDMLNIPYSTSPMALFNGDLLLASKTYNGNLRLMLGDFTGHGLPAAVGAIPTAEVFYNLTRNGYDLSEVIAGINSKLHEILPTGFFCAAVFVEMDFKEHSCRIWTGGLPDILFYGGEPRHIKHHFSTRHLPLGILGSDQIDCSTETVQFEEDDFLLLYTDGLIESQNHAGEQYGQPRLERLVCNSATWEWVTPKLLKDVKAFRGTVRQSDDATLVELPCSINRLEEFISDTESSCRTKPGSHWKSSLTLDADTLRNTDPIPAILYLLNDIQGLRNHRSELFTILSELFNNALHHGILKLDSSIKSTPQGFMQYYEEQSKRLAALENGSIQIDFEHTPDKQGGRLLIRCTDTGEGFDFNRRSTALEHNQAHSGRGIPLLNSLCHSVTYHDTGNRVEVVYLWK